MEKIEQRFVCVWLDNQTNQSKDYINARDDLRTIFNSFRSFNNLNECVDFIININNEKIVFIPVNTLAEKIIPVIHSCEQIHSIYIFNSNKSTQNQWIKDYQKIKGFYNDIKIICQKIKDDATRSENDHVGISFISSSDINSRDVHRQDPSFMYFHLLKEIILNDHDKETEEETKNDMLAFCRRIYSRSQDTLNILDEFQQNFLPELSIYWYTRECFLYRMLNTALWTPEPDVLYKLRYFLRHLHQQILSQSALQRDRLKSMTVYRGQSMSADEIEKLKQNVGGFLSFNNFLSTSLKQEVAHNFLWGSEIGVLFEMHIDSTIQKFPFANIEHLSFQQGRDGEREILFSAGTVFRIVGIDKENDFYRIQLILSADTDEQLAHYTMRTREQTRSSHSFLSLLKLMHELSVYNSVERFAEMLRDDASLTANYIICGSIHHAFGIIYLSRGQSKEALDHFRKSLSLYLTVLPADHPKLSPTYNNIGSVHLAQSDYDTALTFSQLALDCQSKSENPDISSIVAYTNNIASIYFHQENYNEALVYHKRAVELQKQYSGVNDPSLTDTYNMISAIYYKLNDREQATLYREKAVALQDNTSHIDPESAARCSMTTGAFCLSQKQYEEGLNHFNHALKIQQQYLLPNNPSLAITYDCIAGTYYKQEQFEESLSNHMKALEIQQNSLSNDHLSIATSYSNISKDYAGLSFWSIALEYGLKAIEQIKKSRQSDINTLSSYIYHIGHISHQQKQYEKALTYYKEAIELYHTHLPEDDASLVIIYYRIATVYYELKRYTEALSFYQKTLNIELKTLPDNAKTIATTYTNMSVAYLSLEKFDDAFNAANQALDQLRKTLPNNHPDVVQQRAFLDAIKIQQILEDKHH